MSFDQRGWLLLDLVMNPTIIVIVLLCLLIASGGAFFFVRRSGSETPIASFAPEAIEDPVDRRMRIEDIERRGTELLDRRLDLEATRGTLGGQTQLIDDFETLEQQLRDGDISEDEFEREKIQLLGG